MIVICVNDENLEKIEFLIEATDDGIAICVNEHPEKALSPFQNVLNGLNKATMMVLF